MRVNFLYLLIVGVAAFGCSSKRDDKFGTRPGSFLDAVTDNPDYAKLFDARTVEKRIHSEFEPVMTVYITTWDAPLRQSYVEEMRRQFRLQDSQVSALKKEQDEEDSNYLVFIFSAATREPLWNDFHKKDSMWRITLENEDTSIQVDPERVEMIPQKNETYRYFYRQMSIFNQTYKVRFPRAPLKDFSQVLFHVTGTRGALFAKLANPPIVQASRGGLKNDPHE